MTTSPLRRPLLAACLLCVCSLLPPATTGAQDQAQAQAPGHTLRLAEDVAREVEQLRGWKFARPVAKSQATAEAARAYIAASIDRGLAGRRQAILEAFLSTAGLIPRGLNLRETMLRLLEEQVAGYYDPPTSSLHVVERADMPEALLRVVIAHELTHAIDDQYGDIRSLVADNPNLSEDESAVRASLTEGSATALMMQYMALLQKTGRLDAAALMQYVAKEMERAKALSTLPRYLTTTLATYTAGANFLARGDLASLALRDDSGKTIGERFLAARKDLPRSTEQVLHPEKYWDPSQRDEPVVIEDRAVEQWIAAPGRHVVHRDTLGELGTAVLTTPADAPSALASLAGGEWTNGGAEGWGGDRFFLLADGATAEEAAARLTGLRGIWVTAWDTKADRDEFVRTLASRPPPASAIAPLGEHVALVFLGFGANEHQALIEKLAAAPLAFTRDGKRWLQ